MLIIAHRYLCLVLFYVISAVTFAKISSTSTLVLGMEKVGTILEIAVNKKPGTSNDSTIPID